MITFGKDFDPKATIVDEKFNIRAEAVSTAQQFLVFFTLFDGRLKSFVERIKSAPTGMEYWVWEHELFSEFLQLPREEVRNDVRCAALRAALATLTYGRPEIAPYQMEDDGYPFDESVYRGVAMSIALNIANSTMNVGLPEPRLPTGKAAMGFLKYVQFYPEVIFETETVKPVWGAWVEHDLDVPKVDPSGYAHGLAAAKINNIAQKFREIITWKKGPVTWETSKQSGSNG